MISANLRSMNNWGNSDTLNNTPHCQNQFFDFTRGTKSNQILNKPYVPYNKKLIKNSRKLRNDSTLAEVLLWNELKAGKLRGYKFNRQKPVGNFIVDFYCKQLSLALEIDGKSHVGNEIKDCIRAGKIEDIGIFVLRFDDLAVKQSMEMVLNKLNEYIDRFESGSLSEFVDW